MKSININNNIKMISTTLNNEINRSSVNRSVNRRSGKGILRITNSTFFVAVLYITVAFIGSNIMIGGVHGEECGQEEFSKCAEPLEMLHLTSEFSIGAAKKDELDKLCKELRKGVRCIQSYTRRCMPLQQRNQFNKLYHGTNQFIRDLCNEGEFQDEYLKHAPCSEMAKKQFEVCANRYKETMVFLKPNKNQEASENGTLHENLKTICCSINELVDCSEDAARRICGHEAAKFTRELVDKYANSLTKIYCEDFTRHPEICHDGHINGGTDLRQLHVTQFTLLMSILALVFHSYIQRR